MHLKGRADGWGTRCNAIPESVPGFAVASAPRTRDPSYSHPRFFVCLLRHGGTIPSAESFAECEGESLVGCIAVDNGESAVVSAGRCAEPRI